MRAMVNSVALRGLRAPTRAISTSALRMAQTQTPQQDLPRGTVEPGSQVDPQLGDYPAMPMHNQQFRPYSKKWWDTQDRRNFGETVRVTADAAP